MYDKEGLPFVVTLSSISTLLEYACRFGQPNIKWYAVFAFFFFPLTLCGRHMMNT